MNDTACERRYRSLRDLMDRHLRTMADRETPDNLLRALRYVLDAGGKRVRSTLVMLSCEAVGGQGRVALHAGAAMEMMHNFTLVHDDIMDHAETRRGRPTVHTKWDQNVALLAGDVLLGMAYRSLLATDTPRIAELAGLFTEGLLTVCEGQALDLAYEQRPRVTLAEYDRMIDKKTGALLAASAAMGGVIGGGTNRQIRALYRFGLRLGRAFQVQDDLLDVVGQQKKFGKHIGGDIVERKKTFLALTALQRARGRDRVKLRHLFSGQARQAGNPRRLIAEVTGIYRRSDVVETAQRQIARETGLALRELRALPRNNASEMLHWFSGMLLQRTS